MRGTRAVLAACAVLAALLSPSAARGHEFRPALLDVASAGPGRFEITWTPAPGGDRVQPVFPQHCGGDPGGAGRRFFLECGPAGLAGHPLSVAGLAPLRDEVLVRLHLDGAPAASALLTAAQPSLVVPAPAAHPDTSVAPRPPVSVRAFARLGAAHFLSGLDHLLFLAGLLLLVRRPGALLRAVTAFTLAHSLTLALVALGAVRLPPAPVEAAIALSVLLLARELSRPSGATVLARRPWLAAFAFGLLHGLGFAGGLAELRVPERDVPAALFGFNLGLEAAQLAFVAAALVLGRALRPVSARRPRLARRLPAYGIGAFAALWTIERVTAFAS